MEGVRVRAGDRLIVRSTTSSTQILEVSVRIDLDGGRQETHICRVAGDALVVTAIVDGSRVLGAPGVATSVLARIVPSATAVLPGSWYVEVAMGVSSTDRVVLAAGYVSDGQALRLGDNFAPGTGPGALEWLTGGADLAGTASSAYGLGGTVVGEKTRVTGFIVYYNASADVATRTVTPDIRAIGGALPTGFAAAGVIWSGAALTLTASEEGVYCAIGPGYVAANDNGTLAVANNTTAPAPFPYEARADALGALAITIGSGHANDRWSWYILRETWVLPSAV